VKNTAKIAAFSPLSSKFSLQAAFFSSLLASVSSVHCIGCEICDGIYAFASSPAAMIIRCASDVPW
jgi:hypothetical protein